MYLIIPLSLKNSPSVLSFCPLEKGWDNERTHE
ncbi:hypothetical protein Zymop_1044 [Zymomonas mobilis subsp. pomaceae ATCC 29192]|uniref:Uncharacterized protein n=1 Tax=Zymomonas mobilis subsp. pomaceae (strain ATCC 29192 / DSM 22645 / JCM 10191 / CCUG 17912 / NBRC 13757 / NCIMB 11200 / NRRL B-4491 / Barker I) TaxID=579138 RepID=F8ETB5_ZYMMT|nr:hypothetical protein Zymop_1044 [Zymomonas mobilis subsp. pomaceae ATCC 29192]